MASSVVIPPLPEVLLSIQKIMREEDPDIQAIAGLVKEDVALYALFLSAANSPWMGLTSPATSVEHAIMLMGLDRIYSMIQSMIARSSFEDGLVKESFWTAAVDVAGVCSDLANRFSGFDRNQAYSIGMLHNIGMPIMMQNFEHYSDFLKEYAHTPNDKLCFIEKNTFGTDHFLQGALMARQWHLGEEVAMAIRCQPIARKILSGYKEMDEGISTYLAVLTLAKSVSSEFRLHWQHEADDSASLEEMELALSYMHINHSDFDELKEDLIEDYITKTSA